MCSRCNGGEPPEIESVSPDGFFVSNVKRISRKFVDAAEEATDSQDYMNRIDKLVDELERLVAMYDK